MKTCRNSSATSSRRRRMSIASFAACAVVAVQLGAGPARAADRAAWMAEARWGVMTHYLADWLSREYDLTMNVDGWNRLVDAYDAEGLADQIKSTGAGYLVLTIGQNSGYYVSPNATYDKLVGRSPSRCARRDLILDVARALRKRGVKLIVYLPAGAPGGDRVAVEALAYQRSASRNAEFQRYWEAVIREWSERWGEEVAGWWFDGCYWPNAMYRSADPPNFASFAAAARAGNSQSVVAFNPGVVDRTLSITPFEDYTAGEINDLQMTLLRRVEDGRVDGARVHKLSYLGRTWGFAPPRYEDLGEVVIPWTRKIIAAKGAVTWDVPVQPDGLFRPEFLKQLQEIGRAL
jgi:alpha-L-fucosidase